MVQMTTFRKGVLERDYAGVRKLKERDSLPSLRSASRQEEPLQYPGGIHLQISEVSREAVQSHKTFSDPTYFN